MPRSSQSAVATAETTKDQANEGLNEGMNVNEPIAQAITPVATASSGADVYARLAAPFDETFKDTRGGVELEYITGEQVISRLNEVLGVDGWDFEITHHNVDLTIDEVSVLGRLTARVNGQVVKREQFGSQKIKRKRSDGNVLEIGFDLKGAATDSMKKCAMLIGVGLYLSKKDINAQPSFSGGNAFAGGGQQQRQFQAPPAPAPTASGGGYTCEVCGDPLQAWQFRDGNAWTPEQLAGYGQKKYGKVLCSKDYSAAKRNQAPAPAGAASGGGQSYDF